MNNRFQPEMALRELIPLIGLAYTQYFTYRFGSELNDWPAAARRKYAHYYPARLPPGFKMETLLAVRSNILSLFEDTEQAIDVSDEEEKPPEISFWKSRRTNHSEVRKLNKLKHTPIGFICRRGLDRYLIFRGTSAGIEWVQDSMLAQVPWRGPVGDLTLGGGVHRGFLQIYQNIIPHPNSLRLKRGFFSRKWGRLIISGHSLGGALASLAAFELNHLNPIVYTFASPRVFDPDFAAAYRRAIDYSYRITNSDDPFVNLPGEKSRFLDGKEYFYSHVGVHEPVTTRKRDIVRGVVRNRDLVFAHQLRTYELALRRRLDGS